MKQTTDYTCGPACIHRLIPELSESLLAQMCGTTPEVGTTPWGMLKILSLYFDVNTVTTTDYQNNDIILIQDSGYGHWIMMIDGKLWDPWTDKEYAGQLDTYATVNGKNYKDLVLRINFRREHPLQP